MGRLEGQFQVLLGQTITSIGRVALVQNDLPSLLMDTLLFNLTDTGRFELLVRQDTVRFEELPVTNGLFADIELESGEQLKVYPTEEFDVKLPQTVASLTEIWASDGETKFLVAISLWERTRHHIISVCKHNKPLPNFLNPSPKIRGWNLFTVRSLIFEGREELMLDWVRFQ